MEEAQPELVIVPANEATFEDLQTVLGPRGNGARCQCQRYKLSPGEAFERFPVEERADRLREQTQCGYPKSERTSGVVAYLVGEPVGWCAVEPRPDYPGLVRHTNRVVWTGRSEGRADPTVWAVTCVFVRVGFRRRYIGRSLVATAVDFAREHGARAVEGYPINTKKVIDEELHVGTVDMFADAGLTEVHHPTLRRVVMRIDF